ncbi:excisionase family DNA-binding protein [Microbacterium sp. HJ5]
MSAPTSSVSAQPDWASIAQAAAALGVSRDTIRRMITRGDLAAERIGPRLIRVDLNSLRTSPIGGAQ